MTAPRFVAWAAVSSLPQAKKVSLKDQLKSARQHVEKHAGQLVAELVVPGESRNIILFEDACRRIEAYEQLRQLLEAQAFDVLIYLDRSRLGRQASLIMAVEALCRQAGIYLYEMESPPTRLDLSHKPSHDDLLIGAIKSVGAQREVEKLQERHLGGMIERVQRGKFPGMVPWGWRQRFTEEGERIIEADPVAAYLIRYLLLDLYLDAGLGTETIAELLTAAGHVTPRGMPWSKHNVQAILNKVWRYAGIAELNKLSDRPYVRAKGTWPAIITEADAEAIVAERQRRREGRRAVTEAYRFSLVVYCAECGRRMRYHHSTITNRSTQLYCENYSVPHPHRTTTEPRLYEAVEAAFTMLASPAVRRALEETPPDDSRLVSEEAALRAQAQQLEAALHRADDQYVLGHMTEDRYQRQVARLTEQLQAVQQQLEAIGVAHGELHHAAMRSERLEAAATVGLAWLHSDDVRAANAWLRRHIRIWIQACEVTRVEFL